MLKSAFFSRFSRESNCCNFLLNLISINVEEDGFEPDNKEMIEDLIKDGLNELFAQIDEESNAIDEKIAGKSGMGF